MVAGKGAIYAFIERGMDIIHSFRLPFGDMTVTPFYFATIMRLRYCGELVLVSNKAYSSTLVRNMWLKDLFRATASVKSGCVSL